MRMAVKVFLTVDTELSMPFDADWRGNELARVMERDILGKSTAGEFGIVSPMDLLDRHGLKAVFFVEPLFADAVGPARLREIVAMIQERGHEVQLHIHPEWLSRTEHPVVPCREAWDMRAFSEEEQATLLGRAIENLTAAGAPRPVAFRAGNYGADRATLRALAGHGIRFDTSYNKPFLGGVCRLESLGTLLQPAAVDGVYELPVTFFDTWPLDPRPLQLCACSSAEIENVLRQAWKRGWHSVVLVSHSFELIKRPRDGEHVPPPNRVVIRRFERLCRFLAAHRDRFETAGFTDLDPADFPAEQPAEPLRSTVPRTAWRILEQIVSNVA